MLPPPAAAKIAPARREAITCAVVQLVEVGEAGEVGGAASSPRGAAEEAVVRVFAAPPEEGDGADKSRTRYELRLQLWARGDGGIGSGGGGGGSADVGGILGAGGSLPPPAAGASSGGGGGSFAAPLSPPASTWRVQHPRDILDAP